MCGDAAQAEKRLAESSKLFPNGTLWNAVQLPEARAAIELQRDPAKAVELLASSSPYERAYPEVPYLRGLAYLRLRKGSEAAAEFQKVVDHKGASWASTWIYPNWGLYYSISHSESGACIRTQTTPPKPSEPIRISSRCGKTPTRISLSSSKPKKSMRRYTSSPTDLPREQIFNALCVEHPQTGALELRRLQGREALGDCGRDLAKAFLCHTEQHLQLTFRASLAKQRRKNFVVHDFLT